VTANPGGGQPGPPIRVGQYRLGQRLGAGGMGAVYRAFDETLQRPVAVKHLLPSLSDHSRTLRFRREARMAARLNHPAIVHIYEIVETPEGDWIVMELVEGKTLDRLLREGRIDLPSAVRFAREIAEGLAEAHAQGIVHRDLKAANVMVGAGGRVKILDFGLAKAYEGDADQEISTPGTIVGTCHAMSPEQAQGLTVDHRSDLFSLGSLLYEMLTGLSPFHAATPTETLARICAFDPEPVSRLEPAVPIDLADLTHRLLQKAATRRPQSSHDVAAALGRIERGGGLDPTARPRAAEATEVLTHVDRPSAEPPRSSAPLPLTSIERRQMTVLCCDLADAEQPGVDAAQVFDPETLYELMMQLRPIVQLAAQRYDGSCGNAMGHRLLVYFGYPHAHEDDAWRAVRAALDLVGEVAERLAGAPGLGRVSPALRVGVHTGTAVVSTSPNAAEPVVLGATLDVVLRLLGAAAPGAVLMSPATRSLVHRGVVAEPLPALTPSPGSGVAMVPYRVREGQDSGEEAVFDLAPLVGRDRELEQLMTRWDQARAGTGQAVLLTGEPGIGKSRLVRALRERVREGDGAHRVRWLQAHGTPYTQNTPLHAVVQLLHRTMAGEASAAASASQHLEALLARHHLDEAYPLLASLLDLPERADRRMAPMPPERQREQTLDALVALLLEMGTTDPVVLLVEDLHWLDATSLAWLDRLIDQTPAGRLYLVMTLRPNTLDVPWAARAQVTQITLGALSQDDTEQLIRAIVGDQRLGSQVQQQIVARTDGVPLFVEELTRTVIESGDPGQGRELPTTLRDSLTARLSRLGTAREVAQLASVIGRSFTLPLLAAVSPHPSDQLDRELRQLVQSGLVHRRGFGALARYAFKHALVRDAAYDSLLRRERQHLHLRIADALDVQRRAGSEDIPGEVLAHHYTAAEQFELAFRCWLDAGLTAMGRSAHAEAIGHLEQALAALEKLPASSERDEREVGVRSALATSLGVIRGLSSPELVAAYDRLLTLTGQLGDVPHEVFFGLWNMYASRGQLTQARELSRQRLAFGETNGDDDATLLGVYTGAAADLFLGRFQAAREGFAHLLAIYPPEGLATRTIAYDIGAVGQSLLGDVLWALGSPGDAIRASEDAIARGRACSPFTESVALVDRMALAISMRDQDTARARTASLIALSEEHGYQYWIVFWQIGLAVIGLIDSTPEDEVDAAIAQATTAITTMRTAYGSNLQCTRYLAWVVEACLEHGRVARAGALLNEALQLTGEDGERYWLAELLRLQARLRQAEGADPAEVERLLHEAIGVARDQHALTFEQRASAALERLMRDQGRQAEANAVAARPALRS
jgi:serine/threonine protein kinase/tetratricopeptide (TPR) repeat protein